MKKLGLMLFAFLAMSMCAIAQNFGGDDFGGQGFGGQDLEVRDLAVKVLEAKVLVVKEWAWAWEANVLMVVQCLSSARNRRNRW